MITLHGNGFNPNSVIVGAMQNPGGLYAPPGNMMPIGTVGYNPYAGLSGNGAPMPAYMQNMGGYYNPYAGSYYNPALEYEKRRQEEIRKREELRNQSDIMKKLSRNVDRYFGGRGVDIEEHIKRYDPVYDPSQLPGYEEEQEVFKMANIHHNAGYLDTSTYINRFNRMMEETRVHYPDDMTFMEFCEGSGKMTLELLEMMHKSKMSDLTLAYNRNNYKQLLDMHKDSSNYFKSVFGNGANNAPLTIDDLEVKLPDNYADAFNAKKRSFMEAIYANKARG